MKPLLHAGAAVLLAWGLRAEAQFVDPSLRWRTLDTAHFSVHFAERTLAQARTVAEIAETVYPRVTGWLNWKPESRTQIVVLDSAAPDAFLMSGGSTVNIPGGVEVNSSNATKALDLLRSHGDSRWSIAA